MQVRLDASFTIKQKGQLMEELGFNQGGRVQKIIDYSTIHYLRLLMPRHEGDLIRSTKRAEPGLIEVQSPYAHYQNTGILYVMPHNGKGAYHDPVSGKYWSKGKKVPSSRTLHYNCGPNRGAHFVERTLTEHFDDILREAKKGVRK